MNNEAMTIESGYSRLPANGPTDDKRIDKQDGSRIKKCGRPSLVVVVVRLVSMIGTLTFELSSRAIAKELRNGMLNEIEESTGMRLCYFQTAGGFVTFYLLAGNNRSFSQKEILTNLEVVFSQQEGEFYPVNWPDSVITYYPIPESITVVSELEGRQVREFVRLRAELLNTIGYEPVNHEDDLLTKS